jgi:hypothetical protein
MDHHSLTSADGSAQPLQEAWVPGQVHGGLDNCTANIIIARVKSSIVQNK